MYSYHIAETLILLEIYLFIFFSSSVVKHIQKNENEIFKQEEIYSKILEVFLIAFYENHDETPRNAMMEKLGLLWRNMQVGLNEQMMEFLYLVALHLGSHSWFRIIYDYFILYIGTVSSHLIGKRRTNVEILEIYTLNGSMFYQ